jgi:omega-hydroxy-beta-dihydromenaquinone-9 sulfotransferase
MYIDFRLFLKAEYLSLFRTRFGLRRWAYILLFTGLFWLMWLIVAFGRALDHLFFPGFKQQAVREPVFIVAPPRSGTTLTQKLMSLDQERFVHNKLYQTIFPAVVYQRFFAGVASLDRHIGGFLARIAGRGEKKWFGGWDDLHKMRFDEPEEDDGFFVYTFVTEAIYLLFPHVEELWEAGFQDALAPHRRRKVMRYYRSCLQRRLYVDGPDKTILAKATQSSGAVESLLEAFPDAKFITIIRHPYQSVASHVSVFYPVWRAHSPELAKDSPVSRSYALLAVRWFQHLFEFRRKVNPQQYYCIDYRELARDPKAALEKLYDHFGWKLSDAYRSRLALATAQQREFRSKHEYTLEEFGLSKEWIQEELGPLLDYYELPR